MAKKRKATRAGKAARAKPPARRSARRSGKNADETMNIIAGILVVILIGLGIYFYQASQKTGAIEAPTKVATAVAS
jgi:cobalamin biosynthesis protein CobD/CbiB